jgi:adenylate cyclase
MDIAAEMRPARERYALLFVAFAPLIPQLLGSAFNIWYNAVVIEPLLTSAALRQRFFQTVLVYNAVVYPIGILLWLVRVFSLRASFDRLRRGSTIDSDALAQARRRLIHLPWFAGVVCGAAWFLCIPVFLGALWQVQNSLDFRLIWHLPISFCVSGFISITHTFFLVELASQWGLFPTFFRDVRADLMPDVRTLSLRGRGVMWAISASICPIGSLLLLIFAPKSPATNPQWFAVFVGSVGIAFSLCTALMISRLVAKPIDQLRAAADSVARGDLDCHVPVARADEFGVLIGEFNHMLGELKGKERLRQTFGLHVGERAAEQILARDPGLSGVEEEITVMFVDIRSSTEQAGASQPSEVVEMLNDFFRVTVRVVEQDHGGMVNKYLGDGFMAIFGAGAEDSQSNHAQDACAAGQQILVAVEDLNHDLIARGRAPLRIGVGIHSGPAIVGSIGSPQRLEFTAIGNTVNVASRIETLTKTVGRPMLITAAVRERLPDSSEFEDLGPREVRGVTEPIVVFAPRNQVKGCAT